MLSLDKMDSKYIQVIYSYMVLDIPIKGFLNRFIGPNDETLTGTTTLGQSGPWYNSNGRVLHTPQSSKTGV